VDGGGGDNAEEVVTATQRDAAVTHLRFLNIFCNFHHDTFAHAVQLLDLVLGRVKVSMKNDVLCEIRPCHYNICSSKQQLQAKVQLSAVLCLFFHACNLYYCKNICLVCMFVKKIENFFLTSKSNV